MKLSELVNWFINDEQDIIEVQFRLTGDPADEIREDSLSLNDMFDFGYEIYSPEYNILDEVVDIFDDEDKEDVDPIDKFVIEESDLIRFMEEYYETYSDRLPGLILF